MPQLATALCVTFIAYLFWTDFRQDQGRSLATWVPLTWMFLAGSRYVSSWLNLAPTMSSASDYADGSPIDRAVFFSLIVAGIIILAKRRIDWGALLVKNGWLALYLLYCLSSATWSDEPSILIKRWVKELGIPIMALVILTERRPYEALTTILRRLGFLLLPLSMLFIRFYPELARAYRPDGSVMYTGVGHQKNDLGLMCLIIGIYVFWDLLTSQSKNRISFLRKNLLIGSILTFMVVQLLYMSNSQTSLVCLLAAILLLLLVRVPFLAKRPSQLIMILLSGAIAISLIDGLLNLKDLALSLLGRDPTLTNRADVWGIVAGLSNSPLVGVGFMSFWAGERLDEAWRLISPGINQAHNGYLEQYLNLGYVGVAFILIIILSGLLKVRRHLSIDPAAGMLRLCFIVAAILYNYTEASFYGLNNMWLLLLLSCIEVPTQWQEASFLTQGKMAGCRRSEPELIVRRQ